MTFSALILAGGQSRRMGRDKAFLEVDGLPLLARQIDLARRAGAVTVFISGRPDRDYGRFGVPVLHDRVANAGPLAGIAQGLAAATTPFLLVLAVDLPRMTPDFIGRMAEACTSGTGVVPQLLDQLEPAAAIYPKEARAIAETCLASGAYALRALVEALEAQGAMRRLRVDPQYADELFNWNESSTEAGQ